MTLPNGDIWPSIMLGPNRGRIASVYCDKCHWQWDLPHLGQDSAQEVLLALRNAWGLHCIEDHDGNGFRNFDKAVGMAN